MALMMLVMFPETLSPVLLFEKQEPAAGLDELVHHVVRFLVRQIDIGCQGRPCALINGNTPDGIRRRHPAFKPLVEINGHFINAGVLEIDDTRPDGNDRMAQAMRKDIDKAARTHLFQFFPRQIRLFPVAQVKILPGDAPSPVILQARIIFLGIADPRRDNKKGCPHPVFL